MRQPLLLPSVHMAVLVPTKQKLFERFAGALVVLGILVVLLGGLDLSRRVPARMLDNSTLQTAFAPGVTLLK